MFRRKTTHALQWTMQYDLRIRQLKNTWKEDLMWAADFRYTWLVLIEVAM